MADSDPIKTLTMPEIVALAGRLHARGTAPVGADSAQSQGDLLAAAQVIRGLQVLVIDAGQTAGQLALRLADVRIDVEA
jgi:hypothetical protein